MAKIYSFINEKGGSGKTTAAINIATRFAMGGKEVLVVDADKQQSISNFFSIRAELEQPLTHITCVSKFGASLKDDIHALGLKYDVIIIDTGGHDSQESRLAMLLSDIVIIPMVPGHLDTWAFPHLLNNLNSAQMFNERLKALLVINRVSTNTFIKDANEQRDFIAEFISSNPLITLADSILYSRMSYSRSVGEGLGIVEYKNLDGSFKDPKAAQEIESLYNELGGL